MFHHYAQNNFKKEGFQDIAGWVNGLLGRGIEFPDPRNPRRIAGFYRGEVVNVSMLYTLDMGENITVIAHCECKEHPITSNWQGVR